MSCKSENVSRRGFVKNALLTGSAAAAGAAFVDAAAAAPAKTMAWDKSADVVVIGYGGAGAVAAITAAEAGASVILLEKAPVPGGNTRCSSGQIRTSSDPAKYEQFLIAAGQGDISPRMAQRWVAASTEIEGWMKSRGARYVNVKNYGKFKGVFPNAETPDMTLNLTREDKLIGTGKDHFEFFASLVQRDQKINVLLETPATRLLQDPVTKAITGVLAQSAGKSLRIQARKGVVLSSGGFEANRAMFADYVQQSPHTIFPGGTPYNTGDGIRMAQSAGADLWHMNSVEWGPFAFKAPDLPAAFWMQPRGGSYLVVNREGNRFLDETSSYSHCKKPLEVFRYDEKRNLWPNHPWFLIFDEKVRKAGQVILMNRMAASAPFVTYNLSHQTYAWSTDNSKEIEAGWIKKGDTLEDLARAASIAPEGLRKQIDAYNVACKAGKDEVFGRASTLVPLDTAPYYCMELTVSTVNTQGGPRRDDRSQVIDPYGQPIPGLYAAGECGSIWSFFYPGGTNLTECMVSGLLAGRAITGKI